ncbi:MAG: ribonuclease HII, partial [Muricauda sp.]|nr:ribonuclease HII [Allomuricauda sp.]
MKTRLLLFFLAISIVSCEKEIKVSESRLDYLPPSPALIIKISNLTNFKSELKNNNFINQVKGLSKFQSLMEKLEGLDPVSSNNPSLLAIYEVGKDNYDFLFVTTNTPGVFNVDSLANKTVESINYQENSFTKYTLDNIEVYAQALDKDIVLTSSQLLMENVSRTKRSNPVDPMLKRLFETTSLNKSASFYLNLTEKSSLLFNSETNTSPTNPFSEWISLDFTANSDQVRLNGIAMASDSTNNFINLFKDTSPLANKTPEFAPLNTQAVVSYTFDDYQTFARNQNTYLDRVKKVDSLFNTIEEVGIIYLNNERAVLLRSYGTEGLFEFMENNSTASQSYQGSEILELGNKNFITDAFQPLVT